jgi:hypothetical protein
VFEGPRRQAPMDDGRRGPWRRGIGAPTGFNGVGMVTKVYRGPDASGGEFGVQNC